MRSLADCKLYTFVDTAYLRGRAPEDVARQLCDGGSDIIQLRAKTSSKEEVRRMAEKILPIIRKAGVPLVINDHLDIARDLGAEFCHLGQEDFFDAGHKHMSELRPVRHSLGEGGTPNSELQIGLSTHAPDQAKRALSAGPDYIAIGPIYATQTKPTAKPVTLEYVRWAAENVQIPWFAIGGVNLHTLDDVLAAGATRICVVSAILNADNITAKCGEFRQRLQP
jgi:thiamine-phosphate pyrophosphorylase